MTDDEPGRRLFPAFADHTSKDILRIFGHALAEQRTDRGLTTAAVAHRAGITENTLSEIENGTQNPSVTTIIAIAYALQMQPAHLLANATRPRPGAAVTPTHAGDSQSWMDTIQIPGATNVLALQVIAKAVDQHGHLMWGDYPDISQDDWQRIITRARELARPPAAAHHDRAHKLLAAHARAGA